MSTGSLYPTPNLVASVVPGSATWYLPFGGYRGATPTQTITDRDFTGQRENLEIGLLYYNARYYVPGLGRFASADIIIPSPTNPQSYNRYSYVRNSPVNRIDPSGHVDCALLGDSQDSQGCVDRKNGVADPIKPLVTFSDDDWSDSEKMTIETSAMRIGMALAREMDYSMSPREAFLSVYGDSIFFNRTGGSCADAHGAGIECYGFSRGANQIDVYTDADGNVAGNIFWAIHELGHSFESAVNGFLQTDIRDVLGGDSDIDRRPDDGDGNYGFYGVRYGWQQSPEGTTGEEFADMYIGWVYGFWEMRNGALTDQGSSRSGFMSDHMPGWIALTISQQGN